MSRAALGVWLLLVWVALWGDLSVANVLGGLAVAALLLVVFPGAPAAERLRVDPVRTLSYLGFFLVEVLRSNYVVAREVVTPGSSINEGIIALELPGAGDELATIIGDSITLTPGTLTLEIDVLERSGSADGPGGRVLYVHVLHLHEIEEVRADLYDLAARATRAFGNASARAALRSERLGRHGGAGRRLGSRSRA